MNETHDIALLLNELPFIKLVSFSKKWSHVA
jgi:hypothetical protein